VDQSKTEIRPRLLLIINKVIHWLLIGNEFKEIQIYMEFFDDFGLRDTFQDRTVPKSIETDMEKLCTKFSALNVHFDSPSLDFLGSRKPAH